jgi:hypothetical protein
MNPEFNQPRSFEEQFYKLFTISELLPINGMFNGLKSTEIFTSKITSIAERESNNFKNVLSTAVINGLPSVDITIGVDFSSINKDFRNWIKLNKEYRNSFYNGSLFIETFIDQFKNIKHFRIKIKMSKKTDKNDNIFYFKIKAKWFPELIMTDETLNTNVDV